MIVLPPWPPGTVALLSTAGGEPACVPVSTAVRAGDDRVLFVLGPRRDTLARLRADGRVALALLGAGDLAVTLHGVASVVADPLPGAEPVVAVQLRVTRVQDHNTARFVVDDGVQWHWTDPEAQARDGRVREALASIASRG